MSNVPQKKRSSIENRILEDIENFKDMFKSGMSIRDIGRVYGVCEETMKSYALPRLKGMGHITEEMKKERKANIKLNRSTRKGHSIATKVHLYIEEHGLQKTIFNAVMFSDKELRNEFDIKCQAQVATLRNELTKQCTITDKWCYEKLVCAVYDIKSYEEWVELLGSFPLDYDRRMGLNYVLATLPSRESNIINLYHGDNLTDKAIGKLYGICPGRVQQIRHKAYRKLKHISRSRYITLGYGDASKLEAEEFANQLAENCISMIHLNLSNRSYNALYRYGAETVEDVLAIVETGYIYKIRNIGRKSVDEIIHTLQLAGIEAILPTDEEIEYCFNLNPDYRYAFSYHDTMRITREMWEQIKSNRTNK